MGIARLVLSSERLMVVLLVTAALIITVHIAEAELFKLAGVHDTEDNVGVGGGGGGVVTVTVPPVAVMATGTPAADVATGDNT